MSLVSNSHYNELCGQMNPYLAVMEIADDTRRICAKLDNRIPCATALDYAARGEQPNPKDYPDYRLNRVKNYICYIDDIEIKSAIISSYERSLAKNHLIYDYKNVTDAYRQARVRIIMNILWDNRPHKKG